MQYISKPVICNRPGLTQEEALDSLYERYGNVRISAVRQRGGLWTATLLIPKTAEFPPKDEGGESESPAPDTPEDEGPPEEGGDSDGDDDGDEGEEGPPKKSEGEHGKGTEHQILSLLHQIAQALGVGGGMPHEGMPPDGPDAGPPGPPGPGGPPPGAGSLPPVRKPTKLRPGEVLPTQTPIGSPAFSSTKQATGQCPHCGGPVGPDGTCPTCGQNYGANAMGPNGGVSTPMGPQGAYSKNVATFVATQTTNLPVKQAKTELDNLYGPVGYKVKQIVAGADAQGNRELRALLSIR